MITIKNLTAKNFLSIGNQTQSVSFDNGLLTLVLGENHDMGGVEKRNGCGKTVMVNALSYALFGSALTNIKRENLINKINGKNMLATVSFDKDGVEYRIERGRKPNILKFSINGRDQVLQDLDESQGDSRETQKAIEEILGMKLEMFKHIVALNTYTVPFLGMKPGEQREIIEQLLGITQLSEKADALKVLVKDSKDSIAAENTRITTVQASNDRIQQSIEALMRKEKLWNETCDRAIVSIKKDIERLSPIDIDTEIQAQREFTTWHTSKKERDSINSLIAKQSNAIDREERVLKSLEQELVHLAEHKCHACGQELHDDKHEQLLATKSEQYQTSLKSIASHKEELDLLDQAIVALGEIGPCPTVKYDTLEQALNHKNTIATLEKELAGKLAETNPYLEQIEDLKTTALQDVSWDKMNELVRVKEHQDFLYNLLTNKNSFIRKRIIDQNLAFLNQRLSVYLSQLGLPHQVEFQNDLSVSITQLGQDLDFYNLSRGEMNRLILSLSWSFRDVWENLYQPINLLFIDELLDSGLDSSGVECSISVLKQMTRERNKNVFLISHRDDLTSRVNHVLKVIKEGGFTHYATDVDIV
jgi:DNA repair exonuclease SbcCD ATPase subunit